MIVLGTAVLNGTPRIAVSFNDAATDRQISRAKDSGVDIVELRIDQFSNFDPDHVLQQVKRFNDFPVIATVRSRSEGGASALSEQQRLNIFQKIINHVDAVDIELSAEEIREQVISLAHEARKIACVSFHDFHQTPPLPDLDKVVKSAEFLKADIIKIATLANNQEDVKRLALFTINNSSKNIIVIAMGSKGAQSRILFPALGSLLTYAYWGPSTAPGQLPFERTMELLRALYPKYNEEKINLLETIENE